TLKPTDNYKSYPNLDIQKNPTHFHPKNLTPFNNPQPEATTPPAPLQFKNQLTFHKHFHFNITLPNNRQTNTTAPDRSPFMFTNKHADHFL
ncbi:hypothetical protein, partial [Staphylococcus epidermidis]|uniref:hypothetical protein n=1 Tax=Staphylococcus epidermidis TaxID=1282 RepID=UPI001C92D125